MEPMLTAQLLLRRFTVDDAAAFLPLLSLPEILRYLDEPAQATVDDARRMLLARPLADYASHGYGRMACIERATGRLVGFSGLKFVPALGEVDVGYRFLPDCWGRGYASESAAALIEQGRRLHGITRIVGQVHPDNHASVRVLQKLGLRFEKHLDDEVMAVDLYATPLAAP